MKITTEMMDGMIARHRKKERNKVIKRVIELLENINKDFKYPMIEVALKEIKKEFLKGETSELE